MTLLLWVVPGPRVSRRTFWVRGAGLANGTKRHRFFNFWIMTPQFSHNDLPLRGGDQITKRIRGVIAAQTFLVSVHL